MVDAACLLKERCDVVLSLPKFTKLLVVWVDGDPNLESMVLSSGLTLRVERL
jgi:hypothetical protein